MERAWYFPTDLWNVRSPADGSRIVARISVDSRLLAGFVSREQYENGEV